MTTQKALPTAFVLMPFEKDFEVVYERLHRAALKEAGFSVERADTHPDPTNIITKVITKIHQSNLIIADLSKAKANVYYELGLANAMSKPVVMLVNNISKLQFDLQEYHVIEYGDATAPHPDAYSKLVNAAKRFLSGEGMFSSPYATALDISVQTFRDQESPNHAKTMPEQAQSIRTDRKQGGAHNVETQLDDRSPQAVQDEDQGAGIELTTTVEVLDYLCAVSDQIVKDADAMYERLAARAQRIMLSPSIQHFGISQGADREPDVDAISEHMQQYLATLNRKSSQIDQILQYDMSFFVADLQRVSDDPDSAQWQLGEIAREIGMAREHLQATPSQLRRLQMSIDQIHTSDRLLTRNKQALTRGIAQAEQSFLYISQFISKIANMTNEATVKLQFRGRDGDMMARWQPR